MNKIFLRIISLATAVGILLSLSACKRETENSNTTRPVSYEKYTTSETVTIVNIPTERNELIEMLNASLNYVDKYCYKYTKSIKCDADVTNLGVFSSISNARDAFASVFGEKDITYDYEYNTDKALFAENFVQGSLSDSEISDIEAKRENNLIVISAKLIDENNPTDEQGLLHRLGGDYINTNDVNKSLAEFKSSANAVSINADEISIVAKISTEDSSLKEMTVKYTENFNLSGVTLVKITGASVLGTAKTTVKYTNLG